jgi:hypothetical protein
MMTDTAKTQARRLAEDCLIFIFLLLSIVPVACRNGLSSGPDSSPSHQDPGYGENERQDDCQDPEAIQKARLARLFPRELLVGR